MEPEASTAPGQVDLLRTKLFTHKDSDWIDALIVAEVQNTGGRWVQLTDTGWTINDRDGIPALTSSFSYEYPEYLAPGEVGYLIEETNDDELSEADFAGLEISGGFEEIDTPPEALVVPLGRTKLRNSRGGEVETSGTVCNPGTQDITEGWVAAVYLNKKGDIVGASTTNLIDLVPAGGKAAFRTIGSNPISAKEIDTVVIRGGGD